MGRTITANIQQMGHRGTALYIRIRRPDDEPMSWSEVWETFSNSYPDQWAFQVYPPANELVDEANIYHLFVVDEMPTEFNIRNRFR